MTAHQPQRVADQSTGVALAMLSAALQVASLTSPDMGWLGWGALVPILLAIQGLKPGRAAALGLLTGILAGFGIYGWLFEVPSFDMRHAVLLALYIGAYPAIWVTAWALRRNIPLPVCATVLWLLVDYLRGHAGFLALPWGTLAQTQHRNLSLLQTASVVGEHGVTFLVALGNAALASLLLGRERREILNRHEVVLIGRCAPAKPRTSQWHSGIARKPGHRLLAFMLIPAARCIAPSAICPIRSSVQIPGKQYEWIGRMM